MASVDVFVPCYNYARFLRECTESVLDQDGVDVRILIIDDASSDDTYEVAKALVTSDPRVEYRRHAANLGHIETYNEGIEWASSDYALLLSADDVLTPGAFSRAAKLMDAHPEVGFVFGRGVTTERPDYRAHSLPTSYRQKILTGAEFWEISCAETCNIVSTPTAVVRTALQKRIGGYRKDLPHTGDLEMWLRFATHAAVGVIDADQGFYRVHGHNMHVDMFPERLKVLQQHREAIEILFREYSSLIPDTERLRRMAMRGLAIGAIRNAGRLFERGDLIASKCLAEIAIEMFPAIRNESEWKRLRWKRWLGVSVSRGISGVLRSVRSPVKVDRSPFGQCGIFAGI